MGPLTGDLIATPDPRIGIGRVCGPVLAGFLGHQRPVALCVGPDIGGVWGLTFLGQVDGMFD